MALPVIFIEMHSPVHKKSPLYIIKLKVRMRGGEDMLWVCTCNISQRLDQSFAQ